MKLLRNEVSGFVYCDLAMELAVHLYLSTIVPLIIDSSSASMASGVI